MANVDPNSPLDDGSFYVAEHEIRCKKRRAIASALLGRVIVGEAVESSHIEPLTPQQDRLIQKFLEEYPIDSLSKDKK